MNVGSKEEDAVLSTGLKYEIEFIPKVEKELDKIQKKNRRRIIEAIELLQENPRPEGCVKVKAFKDTYRVRVGSYRIVYEFKKNQLVILIIEIATRQKVYKKLKNLK